MPTLSAKTAGRAATPKRLTKLPRTVRRGEEDIGTTGGAKISYAAFARE